jgi:hypothetical protein
MSVREIRRYARSGRLPLAPCSLTKAMQSCSVLSHVKEEVTGWSLLMWPTRQRRTFGTCCYGAEMDTVRAWQQTRP